MVNFLFGVQALANYMAFLVRAMVYQPILWGFSIGFTASTMFYAFISSEDPRRIPHIITNPLHTSYAYASPQDQNGSYTLSYVHFQEEYNRVRIAFYGAVIAFLLVIAIALVQF